MGFLLNTAIRPVRFEFEDLVWANLDEGTRICFFSPTQTAPLAKPVTREFPENDLGRRPSRICAQPFTMPAPICRTATQASRPKKHKEPERWILIMTFSSLVVDQAEYGAARVAASETGARVGLAEESRYGGTCVIRGCVPKKLMVFASGLCEHRGRSRRLRMGRDVARFPLGSVQG